MTGSMCAAVGPIISILYCDSPRQSHALAVSSTHPRQLSLLSLLWHLQSTTTTCTSATLQLWPGPTYRYLLWAYRPPLGRDMASLLLEASSTYMVVETPAVLEQLVQEKLKRKRELGVKGSDNCRNRTLSQTQQIETRRKKVEKTANTFWSYWGLTILVCNWVMRNSPLVSVVMYPQDGSVLLCYCQFFRCFSKFTVLFLKPTLSCCRFASQTHSGPRSLRDVHTCSCEKRQKQVLFMIYYCLSGYAILRPEKQHYPGLDSYWNALLVTGSYMNDLHVYNPTARSWIELTSKTSGTLPMPRWRHGFTAADGKLFVHGGFGLDSSGVLSNAGWKWIMRTNTIFIEWYISIHRWEIA